jgi:flagellum-specific peptidoglycan hydrolase FlgJ
MKKKGLFQGFTILNFVLLGLLFLVSCKASQPVVRTTNGKTTTKNTSKSPTKTSNKNSKTSSTKTTSSKKEQKSSKATVSKAKTGSKGTEIALEATSNIKTYSEEIKLYISDFKDVAKFNMKEYGIPASITLAQGILESGAGKGVLAQNANNHFGIKCHSDWTGESVTHDDDAEQECFRKYIHASESYKDHSYFLTSRPRYASLFTLDKGDYEAWANGLKNAGYATDVKYPMKLIGIIERFELFKFDNEVLQRNYAPKPKTFVANEDEYFVQQGDTLYSLSKKFNISVSDLKQLNLISEDAIQVGQKIKIK